MVTILFRRSDRLRAAIWEGVVDGYYEEFRGGPKIPDGSRSQPGNHGCWTGGTLDMNSRETRSLLKKSAPSCRAHCDYKSGSKSAKIGVFGVQSGVKADTKGVLQHADRLAQLRLIRLLRSPDAGFWIRSGITPARCPRAGPMCSRGGRYYLRRDAYGVFWVVPGEKPPDEQGEPPGPGSPPPFGPLVP